MHVWCVWCTHCCRDASSFVSNLPIFRQYSVVYVCVVCVVYALLSRCLISCQPRCLIFRQCSVVCSVVYACVVCVVAVEMPHLLSVICPWCRCVWCTHCCRDASSYVSNLPRCLIFRQCSVVYVCVVYPLLSRCLILCQ